MSAQEGKGANAAAQLQQASTAGKTPPTCCNKKHSPAAVVVGAAGVVPAAYVLGATEVAARAQSQAISDVPRNITLLLAPSLSQNIGCPCCIHIGNLH